MKNIYHEINVINLRDAKNKIEAIRRDSEVLDDVSFSRGLFRGGIRSGDETVIAAHLQSIDVQLGRILDSSHELLKMEALCLEFNKGITLFDRLTGSIGLDGGAFGDNFIASQDLYLAAISSYKKLVTVFHQGDMEISLMPLKLRLAIEIYFKNMIGYVSAKSVALSGRFKDKVSIYPLQISELLRFFSDKRYRKYAKLPVNLGIVSDINFWSNNLVHTGIVSFPWQSLSAVDLLAPLFNTRRDDGGLSIQGFNYLDLKYSQEELVRDLNFFISKNGRRVEVRCEKRSNRPIEGMFYYRS